MLRLCGLPARYRFMDRKAGALQDPAFLKISPFGEMPVLVDGDRAISNSPIILKHLAAKTGRFGGENEAEREVIENWLYFDQHRILPSITMKRFLVRFEPDAATPDVRAFLDRMGERAMGILERQLDRTPYLAGEAPTIADIACSAYLLLADEGDFDVGRWPPVAAWLERLQELPGWTPSYDLIGTEDAVI